MENKQRKHLGDIISIVDQQSRDLFNDADALQERVDELLDLLGRLGHALSEATRGPNGTPVLVSPCGQAESDPTLKKFARPVESLLVRRFAGGAGEVIIDGNSPFRVPARPLDLLIFAAGGRPDRAGVAEFRSIAEAAATLRTTRSNVFQLSYRLRTILAHQNWNKFLLETETEGRSRTEFRFRTRKLLVVWKNDEDTRFARKSG